MCSRFTAYAHSDAAYLSATWDPTTRPDGIDFLKEQTEWTRLEIVGSKKGASVDCKDTVEFKAYYPVEGAGACDARNQPLPQNRQSLVLP